MNSWFIMDSHNLAICHQYSPHKIITSFFSNSPDHHHTEITIFPHLCNPIEIQYSEFIIIISHRQWNNNKQTTHSLPQDVAVIMNLVNKQPSKQ
uniref:Uncharacterized protein n=1 Tax=Lepeophtheirus salmonis TaxID=72036 RepID=A0A0K2UTG3_LEPSM